METNHRLKSGLRRPRIGLFFSCLVVATGTAAYWYWSSGPEPARSARPAARISAPVTVALVTRQDRPVYATGLGTVQASQTIRIHSQIDGKVSIPRQSRGL